MRKSIFMPYYILILIPALDLDVVDRHRAECTDEGCCQTGIRDERNVVVDRCTTNVVSVCKLSCREVLRDVHHEVDLLVCKHIHRLSVLAGKLRILCLCWPDHALCRDTVLIKVFCSSLCSVEVVSSFVEKLAGIEKVCLLESIT